MLYPQAPCRKTDELKMYELEGEGVAIYSRDDEWLSFPWRQCERQEMGLQF